MSKLPLCASRHLSCLFCFYFIKNRTNLKIKLGSAHFILHKFWRCSACFLYFFCAYIKLDFKTCNLKSCVPKIIFIHNMKMCKQCYKFFLLFTACQNLLSQFIHSFSVEYFMHYKKYWKDHSWWKNSMITVVLTLSHKNKLKNWFRW